MKSKMDTEQKWDQKLNIRTCGRDTSSEDEHHLPYEPTPYAVLERLAENGWIGKENCLLDYGCGKGRAQLALMKPGAFLVNCSRGGLVDEEALLESLKSGHLGGAATDVLREEFPRPDHPLLKLPNFVVTPHVGANTDEALYEVGMCCVRGILDVLAGREPEYPVICTIP